MSTIRLTKAARERILLNVMRHRFTKDCEAISSRVSEFAQRIYWSGVPKGFEAVAREHPGWFNQTNSVTTVPSDGTVRKALYFRGISRHSSFEVLSIRETPLLPVIDRFCLPHSLSDRGIRILSDEDTKTLTAMLDEYEAVAALFREACVQADAILNSSTTLKSLLERWPEVEPFTSFLSVSSRLKGALVVSTEGLNGLLGLPVEDAA